MNGRETEMADGSIFFFLKHIYHIYQLLNSQKIVFLSHTIYFRIQFNGIKIFRSVARFIFLLGLIELLGYLTFLVNVDPEPRSPGARGHFEHNVVLCGSSTFFSFVVVLFVEVKWLSKYFSVQNILIEVENYREGVFFSLLKSECGLKCLL